MDRYLRTENVVQNGNQRIVSLCCSGGRYMFLRDRCVVWVSKLCHLLRITSLGCCLVDRR